ncbi:hypothetical protein KNE206_61150 [Kitasatospora sp. NE20-6]
MKAALGACAEYRATGPVKERFAATTWGQHMSVLPRFYRWAMAEGYAQAGPFTYRTARALSAGTGREVRVNLAVRTTAGHRNGLPARRSARDQDYLRCVRTASCPPDQEHAI